MREGDRQDLCVHERRHLALHCPTKKANNPGSKRANSWAALTGKAKKDNLEPSLAFQHQILSSCSISFSKLERVSTVSGCTQMNVSSNDLPYQISLQFMQSLPACLLLDGALDFFLFYPFSGVQSDPWPFRAQHTLSCTFFSNFCFIICSRSHCSEVRTHEDIKSDSQKMHTCKCSETAQNTTRCSLQNIPFPIPFSVHLKHPL